MKGCLIVFLLCFLLACSAHPPKPPSPYGMPRVPINPGIALDFPQVQEKRCCS